MQVGIKVFLNKLLTDSHANKFNIEKTPPELTIYNSTLLTNIFTKKLKKIFLNFNIQQAILK